MSVEDFSAIDEQFRAALLDADDPSRWFSKEDGLLVADLGELVKKAGNVRLGYDKRLYRYEAGVYRSDGEEWARIAAKNALSYKVKRRHLDEIVGYLKTDEVFIPEHPPTQWINTTTGLLDWRTGELQPHSSDIPTAIQIPHAWNPEAVCPNIDRFLADILPAQTVPLIHELFGLAIYAGNPFAKALLVVGPGGNGKTKLLNLAKSLVGHRNTSAVPLQALAENRFAAAELFGRLANICGDLDARAIKRTDLFKQITGGDQIQAERKFGQPFTFTTFALPMFSANEPPVTSDQSEAWFDRWIVVPMERRFRGTDQDDPHIEHKISSSAELEGLLVHAVAGLQRLMARGRFQAPPAVEAAGGAYRDRLDSVRAFVSEECVLNDRAWTPRSALYAHYRKWAIDNGRLSVQSATFNDRLGRDYLTLRPAGRSGIRGWSGLGLVVVGRGS